MRLTGSGGSIALGALLLVLAGVPLDYPELVMVGTSGLLLVACAVLLVLPRPGLRVRREIRPSRVVEGGVVTCVLMVHDGGRRLGSDLVLTETVAGETLRFDLGRLPRSATNQVHSYQLPAQRRGVYQLLPPSIERTDPVRLAQRRATVGAVTTLYVHPRHHELLTPFGAARLHEIDGRVLLPRMGGVAFYGLRPYVPGDDRRLIHWPSTARCGDLMVRQNTVPDAPGYQVVLDTDAARYTTASFEDAVRIAASLSLAAIRAGTPLRLRTTDELSDRRWSGAGPATMTLALDFLAGVTMGRKTASWAHSLTPDEDVSGVVLVSGRMIERDLAMLARAVGDAALAVVQIDERAPSVTVVPSGALLLSARTSAEFAGYWNGRPQR